LTTFPLRMFVSWSWSQITSWRFHSPVGFSTSSYGQNIHPISGSQSQRRP